jgi:hypothetical protein
MRRKLLSAAAVGMLGAETFVVAQRRGRLFAADTVVRCRDGHLYTTYWIPGVSLKSLRLGWWRLQYCPVGGHWSLVTPAATAHLSEDEVRLAARVHDLRVP